MCIVHAPPPGVPDDGTRDALRRSSGAGHDEVHCDEREWEIDDGDRNDTEERSLGAGWCQTSGEVGEAY